MRVELKQIQRQTGITTLFITHDQSEALAMSDRVAVMSNGRVEQLGTPQTVYNRPSSPFCAPCLGNANIVQGVVAGGQPGAWQIEEGERRWHSQSAEQWEAGRRVARSPRSEEHTSELQSLMRISYAVFCLKKKKKQTIKKKNILRRQHEQKNNKQHHTSI